MYLNTNDFLKDCTRCGSDACYVQEITADQKLEYCMGCGFQSSTAYSTSQMLEANLQVLPDIYKLLIDQEEDTLKVWIPTFVQLPGVGMIYANGTSRENWWWEAGKYDPKNPTKIKLSEVKRFDSQKGFIDAMEYMGLFEE